MLPLGRVRPSSVHSISIPERESGPDAMVAVSEMTHPGDELLLGEPGERWEASTTVFNTRLHRHHLIQAAAVAFWAATYDAVQAVANGDPVIPWPGAGS